MVASVEPMVELRRVVGKFAFFLTGCWLILVFAGLVSEVKGTSVPLIKWAAALLPGATFVPGTYYGLLLHRTQDPDRMRGLWRRCAAYTVAGLVLMISVAYLVYAMNKGDRG